jgi:multiple sugar transport system permease protein
VKSNWHSKMTSSLFVLPYFSCFVVFLFIPIIYGFIISMQKFDLLSPVHPFVGFQNYADIFARDTYQNSIFFQGLTATIKFVLFSVPLLILAGLGVAMLLNSLPRRTQPFFRTVFFMPYAISASVMAVIWLLMFDTNGGFINRLLGEFGMQPVGWLTDLPGAWISLVGATVWWTIGFNMIIFINALNEVPEEWYEAADIDGANGVRKFFHITLPTIKPVMLFIMITSTIASFNIYAQPYLLSRGGPGTETKVLLINILDEAFIRRQVGSASAMAILMAILMMVVSVVQYKISYSNKE